MTLERMQGREVLSVGRMAKLVGIAPETLRRYAEAGVIPPGKCTALGWRYWSPEEVGAVQIGVAEKLAAPGRHGRRKRGSGGDPTALREQGGQASVTEKT